MSRQHWIPAEIAPDKALQSHLLQIENLEAGKNVV
jgi:hypothetical protein